jgi:hypothetical protein
VLAILFWHDLYSGKKLNPKATFVLFPGQKTMQTIRKRYKMNFVEKKQYKWGTKKKGGEVTKISK